MVYHSYYHRLNRWRIAPCHASITLCSDIAPLFTWGHKSVLANNLLGGRQSKLLTGGGIHFDEKASQPGGICNLRLGAYLEACSQTLPSALFISTAQSSMIKYLNLIFVIIMTSMHTFFCCSNCI